MAILDRLRGVNWLVCKLLYGSGLRGIEALRLRVKDPDFDRLQITIRDAKGQKDRVTILPKTIVKTTQIYTHVLNQNAWAIRSPADDMWPRLREGLQVAKAGSAFSRPLFQ